MYDILIKNGPIVDGSGGLAFYGDIAIKDGKIVRIAPVIEGQAAKIIHAAGMQVTPGFIDNHSHSDESVFTGSKCCTPSSMRQTNLKAASIRQASTVP